MATVRALVAADGSVGRQQGGALVARGNETF